MWVVAAHRSYDLVLHSQNDEQRGRAQMEWWGLRTSTCKYNAHNTRAQGAMVD